MCVQDVEELEDLKTPNNTTNNVNSSNKGSSWSLHCELLNTQMENFDKDSSFISSSNSFPV